MTKHRGDVGLERRSPLLAVLRVRPTGLVRGDIGFTALVKRHRLDGTERLRGFLNALMLDGVLTPQQHLTALAGCVAGLSKPDSVQRAETELAVLAGGAVGKPENLIAIDRAVGPCGDPEI